VTHRCAPASFRPWCSTASNSEEYEVESSKASKTLEPVRSGSAYVVPESRGPLRSTSSPSRHEDFRPRFPLARLSPRHLGERCYTQAATRRTGAPGCLIDPKTNGPSRGPQLPWGFCCIRKTLWRLPVLYSAGNRHSLRSRKFPKAFGLRKTLGTVARTARPFRVTGLSKSHRLGQRSRRHRLTCPTEREHNSITRRGQCCDLIDISSPQ